MQKKIEAAPSSILGPLNRRKMVSRMLTVGGALALQACSGSGSSSSGSQASSTSTGSTGTGSTTGSGTGSTTGTNTGTSTGTNLTDWLSGGADAMTVAFPPATDPLDISSGNVVCTVSGTNSYTIGPCYFDVDDYRSDISEGQPGVPMALALKLVDADCNPIEGADIEVWWCNWEGLYSGDNSQSAGNVSNFNAGFCTGSDSQAPTAKWFRGVQTTDAVGNVYFKACFPGWYPSRTTHIHLRVVVGGVQQLVTQFCFDDDLCNDIYQNHSDYTGQSKDTNNDTDTVFGSEYPEYTFIVERQSDASMLAYKAIQIT